MRYLCISRKKGFVSFKQVEKSKWFARNVKRKESLER